MKASYSQLLQQTESGNSKSLIIHTFPYDVHSYCYTPTVLLSTPVGYRWDEWETDISLYKWHDWDFNPVKVQPQERKKGGIKCYNYQEL